MLPFVFIRSQLTTQTYTIAQALSQAQVFIQESKWDDAEGILRQIIGAAPAEQKGFGHYLLGVVYLAEGKLPDAITHCLEAARLLPALAHAYANLGECYYRSAQFEAALVEFRRAIALNKSVVEAWTGLCRVIKAQNDWPALFKHIDDFLCQHPDQMEYMRSMLAETSVARPMDEAQFSVYWSAAKDCQLFHPLLADGLRTLMANETLSGTVATEVFSAWQTTEDSLNIAVLALAARHLYETAHCRDGWTAVFFPALVRFLCSPNIPRVFRQNILLHALRYDLQSSREWNGSLFYGVVVPATRQLMDQGEWGLAVLLDIHTAFSFGQQPLSEAQEQLYWSQMKPLFEQRTSPVAPLGDIAFKRGKPLRIAVLSYAVNNSSPDRVALNVIEGLKLTLIDNPLWIAMGGAKPDHKQYLRNSLVRFVDMSELRGSVLDDDFRERIKTLRKILRDHRIDVLVYTEMFKGVQTLIAQSRVAPVQVFLSMGGSYNTAGVEWDGFITGGPSARRFKEISGRTWRTISLHHPDPYRTDEGKRLIAQGKALRQEKFRSASIILASIGRPQKIDNADFMDMLATLLHANPNAIFLWFGKDELASVRAKMVERGISDQCLFQGWQSVPLYAQVIDIHLDAFPFPNGLTVLDTMAAGVPCVFMDTPEARQTGVIIQIAPLFEKEDISPEDRSRAQKIFYSERGEPLFLLASDTEKYIDYAQRLIGDVQFRKAAGQAGRNFLEMYVFDPMRPARELYRHLEEIVEEKIALLANKDATCIEGGAANHG